MPVTSVTHASYFCDSCQLLLWLMSVTPVTHVSYSCDSCQLLLWLASVTPVTHVSYSCDSRQLLLGLASVTPVNHVSDSCDSCQLLLWLMSVTPVTHVSYSCDLRPLYPPSLILISICIVRRAGTGTPYTAGFPHAAHVVYAHAHAHQQPASIQPTATTDACALHHPTTSTCTVRDSLG